MATPSNHLKDIARAMWRFRADGFLCDTVLYADDGQQARAHSVVLAAASPIFRDALGVDGTESTPRTEPHMIQLPGCDLTTLELALSVIYTGSLEDGDTSSSETLEKVFLLLQQLGVELDKIDGCSVTYIDRTPSGETVKVKSENHNIDYVKRTKEEDASSELESEDEQEDEKANYAETLKIEPDVADPLSEQNGGVVATIIRTVDENGVEVEEVNANDGVYSIIDKGDQVGSEIFVIVSGGNDEHEMERAAVEEMDENDITEDQMSAEGEEGRQVHCPHCSKGFTKVNYLQIHMRTHTGEKPFECDRCGRGFSQRANLHRHYQGHIGEKPHLCHLCGRSFIQKVQLSEHLAQQHADVIVNTKCYTCRICRQAFAERGHLRQHAVKAHPEAHREAVGAITAADKSHVCDTCGRGYTTIGALRMHMRVHTGDLMACSLCDKAYVNRALLEQHLRTHTREKAFECRQCGKAFIYKNALTVHMRTHTGEKPYVCPVCHNSYSQFGHLQSHKKTHTGERPYSCDACGKAYRQRVDLRLHLKRVHHNAAETPTIDRTSRLIVDESADLQV